MSPVTEEKEHRKGNSVPEEEPIVQVQGLSKFFPFGSTLLSRNRMFNRAVCDVDLSTYKGETLAIMGESGCGKTTLAKVIVGLLKPTAGTVFFRGEDVFATRSKRGKMQIRRNMQMVFQNPQAALNPMMTIREILKEPFVVHEQWNRNSERTFLQLVKRVGLQEDHLNRRPRDLSGGQQQRVGICRAVALNPELVVLDEPTSALDVSVQAQVLNLLLELKKEMSLTFLFISHDAAVVEYVSDRVAIMYLGRIMEIAPTSVVFGTPLHPYTKALNLSVLTPHSWIDAMPVSLDGTVPSPKEPPSGCVFHPRCPRATAKCKISQPPLEEVEKNHWVACMMDAPAS